MHSLLYTYLLVDKQIIMDIADIRGEIYHHLDAGNFLSIRMCCIQIKDEVDNIISNEKRSLLSGFTEELSYYNTNFTLACYIGCLKYAQLYHHCYLLPTKHKEIDYTAYEIARNKLRKHNEYEHYINTAIHNACNQGQIEIIKWLMTLSDRNNNQFQIPLETDKSILQTEWKIPREDLMKMITA